jgi:hypothetical protein
MRTFILSFTSNKLETILFVYNTSRIFGRYYFYNHTKRILSKLIFSAATIISAATISYAQQDTTLLAGKDIIKQHPDTTLAHPDTKAGSAAFLLTISGLNSFGLQGFPTASFILNIPGDTLLNTTIIGGGGKWFFLDDIALRGIFGFTIQNSGIENAGSGKTSLKLYGLSIGVEKHPDPIFSVSPYIGMQTTFAGATIDIKKTSGSVTMENKVVENSLTIGPLIGFDWYLVHGIAIGGEYVYAYSTLSTTVTTPGGTTDNPSASKLFIGSANVHVAVHF